MIKAVHNKYVKIIFDLYLKRLLKSSFTDFSLVNSFPKIDDSKGLVVVANHFSWWDGFFVYWLLNKMLNRKIFIMMLENQLKRYWFFSKIGCYSIDLENKQSTISSLRYTLEILKDANNVVVIFPQGEIQPYEKRPVELKNGINFIAKKSVKNFSILSLGFKIHYGNDKKPSVYTRCGEVIDSQDLFNNKNLLFNRFVDNLDSLDSEFLTSINKTIL